MSRVRRDRNLARLLILAALSALAPISMDAYLPALPELGYDLDASASATQATLTACLIGLGAGQLLAGPLSDSLGRRRPLLVGLAAFTAASVLCALAPSIWTLITLRLLQGIAGGAGIVIARAVARDLFSGSALARYLALMMTAANVAPVLAPLIGAQFLHFTSWRGVFVAVGIFGAALLAGAAARLAESLPRERRHPAGLARTSATFRRLLADSSFVGYLLCCGLPFAAMFAYIAGSPFVLQDIHGLSATEFSLVFAVNSIGIMAASRLSAALVRRVSPRRVLAAGLIACAVGSLGVLLAVVLDAGLAGLLPPLFVMVSSVGLALPNATALALADHEREAGSASALVGVGQFVTGAAVAPLVGVAGPGTALPMAILIAICGTAALLPFALLTR